MTDTGDERAEELALLRRQVELAESEAEARAAAAASRKRNRFTALMVVFALIAVAAIVTPIVLSHRADNRRACEYRQVFDGMTAAEAIDYCG